MTHPVNWFQISSATGGAEALQTFYRDVFGWKMGQSPEGSMAMVEGEKGGIPGGIGDSQDGKSSVAVYAGTDDIKATLAKVEAAGGKPAMEPMELPGGMGWISGFVDPAGNWTGLWQPGTPAPKARTPRAKKAAKKSAKKAAAPKKTAKKAAPKKAAKKGAKKAATKR